MTTEESEQQQASDLKKDPAEGDDGDESQSKVTKTETGERSGAQPRNKNAEKRREIDILDKWVVKMDETFYTPPAEVQPGDTAAMSSLDTDKLIELREAFNIIDFDGNGVIDASDLKGIFLSMGQNIPDEQIQQMINEAPGPLNFDAFACMMALKTIDIDSEEDLVEAFKMWDEKEEGVISEERMMHELMTHGEKFSEQEAWDALEEAPIKKGTEHGFGCSGDPMIEYAVFAKQCAGLRKKT